MKQVLRKRRALTDDIYAQQELLRRFVEQSKNIEKSKKQVFRKSVDALSEVVLLVKDKLGKYKDDYISIQDPLVLKDYIDTVIKVGEMTLDTETTGLDPITDKLVGVSLYTDGKKPAYIPINHIRQRSGVRIEEQLTMEQVRNEFQRLIDNNVKIIYFNAKFDIRVIKNQMGLFIPPFWDGFIAGKVLKDNEQEANLKYLWKKYCSPDKDAEHFTFDKLFEGITFDVVPLDVAYLYAAHDALMTWELYKYQESLLTADNPICIEKDNTRLAFVFHNIEMPVVSITADIEDAGIALDLEYGKILSEKYHKLLEEKIANFNEITSEFSDRINAYKLNNPNAKLEYPINISSPTQLAILLYDILQIQPVSRKEPRGTGVEVLKAIDHKYNLPICKAILDYRGIEKLISTYIDKLPKMINSKTGRLHCNFHSYGTATSRFSSSAPNLQNIPSHNKDIRPMFTATDGYVLLGGDFSKQEPVIVADLSNDQKFIADCASGKDVYAVIGSAAYSVPYEQCLEFNPDGTTNPQGKARRSDAKKLFLGICYGMSIESIAEGLNKTSEEAQAIIDTVMANMPGLKNFMIESEAMAKKYGWVETKWGTRRHIPDMQLEPYEITCSGTSNFDPFFDSKELGVIDDTDRMKMMIINDLLNAKYSKQRLAIKDQAKKMGFNIKDNTRLIGDAKRLCVNCMHPDTEILTKTGWKKYDELTIGEAVMTLNLDTHLLEWGELQDIIVQDGDIDCTEFKTSSFNVISTKNHKWVTSNKKHPHKYFIKTTEQLTNCGSNWCDYRIVRIANNEFSECALDDNILAFIGLYLTDGYHRDYNGISIYQSSTSNPQKCDYIDNIIKLLNVKYSKSVRSNGYCTWTICHDFGKFVKNLLPNRMLTYDFINSLSQRQAKIVVENMLIGDGIKSKNNSETKILFGNKLKADLFQYLCVIGGFATNCKEHNMIGRKCYSSKISNKNGYIEIKNIYYTVHINRRRHTHIYKKHLIETKLNRVWCPTTSNNTWVARYNGRVFITHNSRIQGSAANQTKQAMRLINENKRLKELGFRILLLIHDEIVGECPIENAKEARDLFVGCMLESGKELKSKVAVDCECSFRWYGKTIDIDNLTPDEIRALIAEENKKYRIN